MGERGSFAPRQPLARHVLHSGDYFLFETDSEEDEESVLEDQKLPKQSAFQLAYQAWVTNTRSALRERQRQERAEREMQDAEGDVEARQVELKDQAGSKEEEEEASEEEEAVPGRSTVVQRALNMLRFVWLLCQATVDGLTQWLRAFTREHEHMSTVLGRERFVLTQKLDQPAAADGSSSDTALPGTAAGGCERVEVLSNDTTGYNTSASEERIPALGSPEDGGLPPSGSQEPLAVDPEARPRTASELLSIRYSGWRVALARVLVGEARPHRGVCVRWRAACTSPSPKPRCRGFLLPAERFTFYHQSLNPVLNLVLSKVLDYSVQLPQPALLGVVLHHI
ncbi:Piezo-type mechanosensitive ion channel component 1 [Varanus komodoensis]|nr:Piezo-type mechanosensitive ion channel component 1 [Varanus komodoensis]